MLLRRAASQPAVLLLHCRCSYLLIPCGQGQFIIRIFTYVWESGPLYKCIYEYIINFATSQKRKKTIYLFDNIISRKTVLLTLRAGCAYLCVSVYTCVTVLHAAWFSCQCLIPISLSVYILRVKDVYAATGVFVIVSVVVVVVSGMCFGDTMLLASPTGRLDYVCETII